MYIDKWWGNYIGETDDSLSLIDYFGTKIKSEYTLTEIFSDLGIDKQIAYGNFYETQKVEFIHPNGMNQDFYYAIDVLIDLSAIILEILKNGQIHLKDLDNQTRYKDKFVKITITNEQLRFIIDELSRFIIDPSKYDLSEVVPESDLIEMTNSIEDIKYELRKFI